MSRSTRDGDANYWFHSTMDSASVYETENLGSIPSGTADIGDILRPLAPTVRLVLKSTPHVAGCTEWESGNPPKSNNSLCMELIADLVATGSALFYR